MDPELAFRILIWLVLGGIVIYLDWHRARNGRRMRDINEMVENLIKHVEKTVEKSGAEMPMEPELERGKRVTGRSWQE